MVSLFQRAWLLSPCLANNCAAHREAWLDGGATGHSNRAAHVSLVPGLWNIDFIYITLRAGPTKKKDDPLSYGLAFSVLNSYVEIVENYCGEFLH